MSTPTREIRNLSIGGKMPTTRSQAQREKQRKSATGGRADVMPSIESEAGPSITEAPTSPDSIVRGRSGLIYDVRQLSPASTTRASAGLSSEFTADERSKTFRAGNDTYHAIQLNNRVAIRIHDPANGSHRVDCTCDDFKRIKSICVHIYWLFDSLNVALAGLSHSTRHSVTKDTVLTGITDLYSQIARRIANKSLHELLNKGLDEDMTQTIQDMLSVFDPKRLPDRYGEEFIGNIPTTFTSYQDLVTPRSLPETIFGLARHNELFRRELRNALTRDFCAVQLFEKLSNKAKETFERLDRYVQFGPRSDPRFVEGCANILRQITKKIADYKDDRAPLKVSTKSKAAEVLVDLLIEVCERNKDIYLDITWQKTAPDPEDQDDRNLFTNLIGDPPQFDKDPEEEDEDEDEGDRLFFLDPFSTFAPEEWKHLLEPLERALDMLKSSEAPQEFVEKLEDMIGAYREGSYDPYRITSRRPTLSGERESQRRRVD